MNEVLSQERLLSRMESLRPIGRDPLGGITRPFGSAAEREARRWFLAEAGDKAGLATRVDAAGNIWALFPGRTAGVLAAGSHMDTVPHGGAYDGALGVVMALEAVQGLKESGYQPEHTLGVLVLAGEEPNGFRLSTLGSRLLTGVLTFADIEETVDDDGYPVLEALRAAGASSDRLDLLGPSRLIGFIEPHIEQGPRLWEMGLPVGVVTLITGIVRHHIRLQGQQNHAGTTPWAQRRDAVQAFAQAMAPFRSLLDRHQEHLTGTVGFAKVHPNAVNIVPSQVEFIVEWRSPNPAVLEEIPDLYWREIQTLGRKLDIGVSRRVILEQSPSPLDGQVQAVLSETIGHLGLKAPALVSWAGHDAAHIARKVPTGMLFIRSNGQSHCPDEGCTPEDMVTGTRVLTAFLRRWDRALPTVGGR